MKFIETLLFVKNAQITMVLVFLMENRAYNAPIIAKNVWVFLIKHSVLNVNSIFL